MGARLLREPQLASDLMLMMADAVDERYPSMGRERASAKRSQVGSLTPWTNISIPDKSRPVVISAPIQGPYVNCLHILTASKPPSLREQASVLHFQSEPSQPSPSPRCPEPQRMLSSSQYLGMAGVAYIGWLAVLPSHSSCQSESLPQVHMPRSPRLSEAKSEPSSLSSLPALMRAVQRAQKQLS